MIARVEAVQAWLENVTYQLNNMSHKEQSDKLAGYEKRISCCHWLMIFPRQIALLKMFITRNGQQTAEDAAQIFGGRSLTQTGMGRVIENVSTPKSVCKFSSNTFSIDVQRLLMLFWAESRMFWVIWAFGRQ